MDTRQIFEQNPILAIMRNVPLEDTLDYAEAVVNGGVDSQNIGSFFRTGFLGAGLGRNIMPAEAVRARDWKMGTAWVKKLVAAALDGRAVFEQIRRDKE